MYLFVKNNANVLLLCKYIFKISSSSSRAKLDLRNFDLHLFLVYQLTGYANTKYTNLNEKKKFESLFVVAHNNPRQYYYLYSR